METHLLHRLRARSAEIHVRWETLLRMEPVSGPLANPDTLVRVIPETLAAIFERLAAGTSGRTAAVERLPGCECGCNPYLAFFLAAERAFVEALVLAQAEPPRLTASERDLTEVHRAVRDLGRDEIDTFCGICANRCQHEKCRHVVPA